MINIVEVTLYMNCLLVMKITGLMDGTVCISLSLLMLRNIRLEDEWSQG